MMNEILLINRIDSEDSSDTKRKIRFVIGDMDILSVENKLIELLNKSGKLGLNDITYKYNGVELNIDIQKIPIITKLLINNDIFIYSIYQVYNPDL